MAEVFTMSNYELINAIECAHEKVQKIGTAQPQYKTWQAHLTALVAEQRRRAEDRPLPAEGKSASQEKE